MGLFGKARTNTTRAIGSWSVGIKILSITSSEELGTESLTLSAIGPDEHGPRNHNETYVLKDGTSIHISTKAKNQSKETSEPIDQYIDSKKYGTVRVQIYQVSEKF